MNEELVAIATYPTPNEAAVARVALEAEGIKAFLTDDHLIGMGWIFGNAVGHVKLLVAVSDAERASQLLEAGFDDWPLDDAEPWNCSQCGEEVDAEFDECWSCGAVRPEHRTAVRETINSAASASDDIELLPPLPDGVEGQKRAENPYASPLATETAKEEPAPTEATRSGDEVAHRAWRASVFGLVLCPPLLNFYSAWLLLTIAFSDCRLSNRGQRWMYGAWAINLLAALGTGLFYGIFWVL
ncbi:MAG TPA: hypothetical protein VFW87_19965 [Pirellulales bacterium]|nr:hypothetical protein [Pirellulales bacterium]